MINENLGLNVQVYLRSLIEGTGKDNKYALEKLKEEFGINYTLYEKEHCVILSYSQINSPKTNPIVRECRGTILSDDFTKVYCKPFDRFYNYGEAPEQQKEFTFHNEIHPTVVYEKYDGSLVNFWYHPELGWCFSTRSRAFAEGEINTGFSNTFHDAVVKVFPNGEPTNEELDNFFCRGDDYIMRNYTWSFEFVSPENRNIKDYGDEYGLYFIGLHRNYDGYSVSEFKNVFKDLQKYSHLFDFVELAKEYNLNNFDEIKEFIKGLNPTDEGFVAYDTTHGIRVKIKNPVYLEIASKKINGKLSKSNIINMIIDNEYEEYLTYFPHDKKYIDNYLDIYNRMIDNIINEFEKVKDIDTSTKEGKKEYALTIIDNPYKSILFSLKSGKNIFDIFKNMSEDSKIIYFEKFENIS